ncbi:hypothetical protein ABTZ46_17910 [Nocardioides sp. NPDC126508]
MVLAAATNLFVLKLPDRWGRPSPGLRLPTLWLESLIVEATTFAFIFCYLGPLVLLAVASMAWGHFDPSQTSFP